MQIWAVTPRGNKKRNQAKRRDGRGRAGAKADREGRNRSRGSFQNCLADMLILADADNHEQFDELACLCCCGQSHWRKAGQGRGQAGGVGGGGGARGPRGPWIGWRGETGEEKVRGEQRGVANMHHKRVSFLHLGCREED